MQYLGIDWGTRRAAWCAVDEHGTLREGMVGADEDGLSRLALALAGEEVRGCVEMMSGAVWVRDQLATVGWNIRIADARKVKAIAPLACKTDRVDARGGDRPVGEGAQGEPRAEASKRTYGHNGRGR